VRGAAAKLGASFSGLTKSRPKPAPRTGATRNGGPQRRPATARPAAARPAGARPAAAIPGGQVGRKAQLGLARIEPLSVLKFSFLLSLAAWIILFVGVAIIYFMLAKLGVFVKIEHTMNLVTSGKGSAGTNAASWFSASRVLGYTMLVGTINVFLITALSTIGAVLYNLIASLTGGIEVTLKETD
jgi:hypothetical protein